MIKFFFPNIDMSEAQLIAHSPYTQHHNQHPKQAFLQQNNYAFSENKDALTIQSIPLPSSDV